VRYRPSAALAVTVEADVGDLQSVPLIANPATGTSGMRVEFRVFLDSH
jgi:hypothetical protein